MTWLERFENHLVDGGNSEKTVRAYMGDVQQYEVWYAQRYDEAFGLSCLNGIDVKRYRKHLQVGRKLRPATINRKMTALRALVRFGLDEEAVYEGEGRKVLENASYMDVEVHAPKWIKPGEFPKLESKYRTAINDAWARGRSVRHEQAVQQYAVMMMMAGGALRISEAVGLDMDDLVLGERKGRVIVHAGKGGEHREPKIPRETIDALMEWLELRGDAPGPVFVSQKGNRLSSRQVQRYFKEMVRLAGISEDYTPHSLRHFSIKRVREAAGLAVAQRHAGHKRITTTLLYAMAGGEEVEEAVERIFD